MKKEKTEVIKRALSNAAKLKVLEYNQLEERIRQLSESSTPVWNYAKRIKRLTSESAKLRLDAWEKILSENEDMEGLAASWSQFRTPETCYVEFKRPIK